MRSGKLCLLVLAGTILPALGAERSDYEVDLAIPPGEAFRLEVRIVPGKGGAEVLAERSEHDIDLRIRFEEGLLAIAGTGLAVRCDPGAEHLVRVTCGARRGAWEAAVAVASVEDGRVLLEGTVPLSGRPERARARAGLVLAVDLS